MIDWVNVLPLIIGGGGLTGLIFTVRRARVSDTTAVLEQQTQITEQMAMLADEQREHMEQLRTTTERLRKERDACLTEVERLRA